MGALFHSAAVREAAFGRTRCQEFPIAIRSTLAASRWRRAYRL